MSCDSIRKLLPLYAVEGDDLTASRREAVRVHLAGCTTCRAEESALRTSLAWFRARAVRAPEIGGATLDGLRREILRRVQEQPAPSPFVRLVESWKAALERLVPQPALAAGVAAVLALSSVTLLRPGQLAVTADLDGAGAAESITESDGDPRGTEDDEPSALLAEARFAPDEDFGFGPEQIGEESEVASEEPVASAEQPIRIEIQTQDPNVRIIWFGDRAKTAEAGD